MLKLSKSLPLLMLACAITGNLLATAEGLNIYQPKATQEEGIQGIVDEGEAPSDEAISPVNYPAMTPASSLLEEPEPQKQEKIFPKIHQRNQTQPDLIQPSKQAKPSNSAKPSKNVSSTSHKLKLSSLPSPLSPNAAAELTPIAWKRSEIPSLQPRLKNLPVEPMAENQHLSGNASIQSEAKPAQEPSNRPASSKLVLQPMSSLPAIASASLEPMMAGPDDIPALRDVNPSLPSLSPPSVVTPSAVSPAVFQPVDEQGMNAGNLGTQGNATDSVDVTVTAKKSGKIKAEKPPRPVVYYTPLPAIAVFPVLKHGTNVMFSDVPVVFAKELSRRLELQAPGTQVLNPYYTVESMQAKGIDHLYQKMMKEYRFAGRPDPVTLDYLLKQLTANSERPISRVFFVEADLDTNEPMSPKGPGGVVDRVRNVFDGSTPDFMKYYVRSHVQVYDTENPNMPQVWNFDWKYPVRAERFNNVTTSVFSDSDSLRAFNETSGMLSKAALLVLPKSVYMDEHVDSSVQGYLAGRGNAQDPQSQLEPGMHPINTATPESGETDENNIGLRARSGRPKRPVTESTRQVINQVNKWLY